MAELKDSGARRQFDGGAVRDIQDGKGRCDLLPLSVISELMEDPLLEQCIREIHIFVETKLDSHLLSSIRAFISYRGWDIPTAILEVAKHYEDGCNKYGERNWEKGIDLHCYIDSGVRHLMKFVRGDTDEPHDRAFLWNMLGAIWTVRNLNRDDILLPNSTVKCSHNENLDTDIEGMRKQK